MYYPYTSRRAVCDTNLRRPQTSQIVYRSFEEQEIINTTTAAEIFRFDFKNFTRLHPELGMFGPSETVRVTMFGRLTQNVGGTSTATFTGKMGSTTLGSNTADPSTGSMHFKLVYTFMLDGPTQAQVVLRELYVGDSSGNSGEARTALAISDVNLDLETDYVFTVEASLSTASSSFSLNKEGVIVEAL